jgi:uncharacterized protein (TIGR02271 family)
MTYHTIVAAYETPAQAAAAVHDLQAANVLPGAIGQHTKTYTTSGTASTPSASPLRDQGFWANLFGSEPDHDTSVYDRSIESGASVLTVKVPDDGIDGVTAILEAHNPIDLDESAVEHSSEDTPMAATETRLATSSSGDDTIRLAQENLAVGKRAVSGATTRIRRYVVETPVEEQVTLQGEKVTIDRRPVTGGAPVAEFTDKTIEMTETHEEAVVSKTARVTEEVSLRKQATDRVETVKDTVRRDEVEIEQVPGDGRTKAIPPRPASNT